jgi:AcrR family transcriptional regulator
MQQPQLQNTKAALIRAAERLFAEKGLGGVSVKDITRAAGARNESALHYHFGGVDALIREVFASRYREIEEARVARLAELRLDEASDGVEAVLEAAIAPFLAACLKKDGRLYARFCVQLATDPRFDIADLIRDIGMPSLDTMRIFFVGRLRGMPNDVLATRLRRTLIISLILAADYARQIELKTAPPIEDATREAAATLAGFLRAPAPKATTKSSKKKP